MVLGTNGTLIEKGVAKRLKSSGIARVGVSIDSIDQDVHNRFRRNRDAYQLTLKGIEALKYAQIPFQIHTTVMGLNYHQILEISEFAKNLGASSHHIFFLVHTGRAKEMREEVEVSEDAREIDVLLRKILSTNQIETRPICAPQFVRIADEMGIPIKTRGCLAGISYAVVLPNGDLHPCPYLPIKAGNVRDEPLEKLFFESPLFYMLRTQKYKGGCGRCLYRDKCGGCRARAYQSTGDYMERDPLCSYSD
jgi:radical SAM protein with 4Fe4S-binding SPASM domain